MNAVVFPSALGGNLGAIPSKSFVHRALICASLADEPTRLRCPRTCADIEATADCLRALGAVIERDGDAFVITPCKTPDKADLFCRESGSTLRFLLPVAAALGVDSVFHTEGRLSARPLSPLYEEMERHGISLSGNGVFPMSMTGKLQAGEYSLDGGVSSQFFTGLLLALPLAGKDSTITVEGKLESAPYVELTLDVMRLFGVEAEFDGKTMTVHPAQYRTPGVIHSEGDWSNAAFWLAAGVIGGDLSVDELRLDSAQGDKVIVSFLRRMGARITEENGVYKAFRSELHGIDIDASHYPDLVPILAVTAAFAKGTTRFTNAARLRLKESDRIASVCDMINALGGSCVPTDDGMIIEGKSYLPGGTVDACGDHRIAMSAAVAACRCASEVTIVGAEATAKSYPQFFEDYEKVGAKVCFHTEK